MFKDLHWIIILFIIGLIIFYSNNNSSSMEGYKNSIVKIGGNELTANHFLNSNEFPFGFSNIYEVGRIYNPEINIKGYHDTYYAGYYKDS